ncbi:hypothetical protein [Streptomyces sp. NPDC093589]|uniref:hypothetical protein n=1 Tax=Streptomyces sp. NPDC093589 TaxID=3366043 RepID=UPI00380A96C8
MTVEDFRDDWLDHPDLTEEQRGALCRLAPDVLAAALEEAFRPHENLWLHVLDSTRNDAIRLLLAGLAVQPPVSATDVPRYADAAELDGLGRPLCEGTTHQATRNCTKTAEFQLKEPGARTACGYACQAHAGQVARFLVGGESGSECGCLLVPIATVE